MSELDGVLAQLRHAYQQLVAHDGRWSRRGMKDFANGLLAPQIRKLEQLQAADAVARGFTNQAEPSTRVSPWLFWTCLATSLVVYSLALWVAWPH
jgi:hypothetical protein